MPYKLLRFVISHMQSTMPCPGCNRKFDEDFIFVIATGISRIQNSANALFFIICPACMAEAFVFSVITEKHIHITTRRTSNISVNEVLDMHNFLKTWQGDVKELFKET